MAAFNFRLYFDHFIKSLFPPKGHPYYLTVTRFIALIIYYTVYTWYQLFTRFCFILDHILFGSFRKTSVTTPVFIIGNFRSGSTFLHRLMAKDSNTFTSMQTWEIYFCPSITQRVLVKSVLRIDRLFGRPLGRLIDIFDNRVLGKAQIHKTKLRDPEEDEGILIHVWNMILLNWIFPFRDTMPDFHRYDTALPVAQKNSIMKFYRQCVQRHLEYHGSHRIFLSKNPSFTPKIETIMKWFPDSKFIYLVRDPLEMFPSVMSWFTYAWNYFSDLKSTKPFHQFVVDMAEHWYRYPLRFLDKKHSNFMVIRYTDLVSDPVLAVKSIYNRFSLDMSTDFSKILETTNRKNREYKSDHDYTPEEFGFTQQEIVTLFSFVYKEYNLPLPSVNPGEITDDQQKGRHFSEVMQ
jgi:hypothetical protein